MTTLKESIEKWWSENPMTYGFNHGKPVYKSPYGTAIETEIGSEEFFRILDNEFFMWNKPLHTDKPFGKIFPYEVFKGENILGTMAMLWAREGSNVMAVDLSPFSVAMTKRRFEIFKLPGFVQREDANNLSFDDNSFDYVYSWGVLHHSPDIERSISELFRVLKPAGEFGVMLYNRHSIMYRYMIKYIEGFLHGESYFLEPLELASRYTDGAREEGNPYTWPVTREEVTNLFSPYVSILKIKILGTELDSIFKFLLPGLGYIIPKGFKKPWARRWGWSLWIYGRKA
jgi:SAM-dependent methyltransferase